jgi:hypothetical protein
MKIILAGNRAEFWEWQKWTRTGPREAIYMVSAQSVRGYSIRPGDLVRVGTWYQRRDLEDLEEAIQRASHP